MRLFIWLMLPAAALQQTAEAQTTFSSRDLFEGTPEEQNTILNIQFSQLFAQRERETPGMRTYNYINDFTFHLSNEGIVEYGVTRTPIEPTNVIGICRSVYLYLHFQPDNFVSPDTSDTREYFEAVWNWPMRRERLSTRIYYYLDSSIFASNSISILTDDQINALPAAECNSSVDELNFYHGIVANNPDSVYLASRLIFAVRDQYLSGNLHLNGNSIDISSNDGLTILQEFETLLLNFRAVLNCQVGGNEKCLAVSNGYTIYDIYFEMDENMSDIEINDVRIRMVPPS